MNTIIVVVGAVGAMAMGGPVGVLLNGTMAVAVLRHGARGVAMGTARSVVGPVKSAGLCAINGEKSDGFVPGGKPDLLLDLSPLA